MSIRLNKRSFDELIVGDIEWLNKQSRTLEMLHIKAVLEAISGLEYDLKDSHAALVAALKIAKNYVQFVYVKEHSAQAFADRGLILQALANAVKEAPK